MNLSARLAFKAHTQYHVVDVRNVLLLTEAQGTTQLEGELQVCLAPLLDGTRSADEIALALCDQWPRRQVYRALMQLERAGHVCSANAAMSQEARAFWHGLGCDAARVARNFARAKLAVRGFGGAESDVPALSSTLFGLGLKVVPAGRADLVVALVDDYLHPDLKALDRAYRQQGKRWFAVKPVGQLLWLGPMFGSADACWACLTERLRENRPVATLAEQSEGRALVLSRGTLPSTRAAAIQLAATELAKWIATPESGRFGETLTTIDLAALESRRHPVIRVPGCAICGTPREASPLNPFASLHLEGPALGSEGTRDERSVPLEQTLAKLERLVSPLTGIVADPVATPIADDLHVCSARQNAPLGAVRHARHLESQAQACGKGQSAIEARVSCLAEAVERYSCFFRGTEPIQRARYADLGEQALHPNALLQFSSAQFAEREHWNRMHPGFNRVFEPFDAEGPIDWTRAWSLTKADVCWLPTAYCYFAYPRYQSMFCRADSNGCAAGNTVEEAIVRGFLELVERDATAVWWYNRVRRPEVDLASFQDPYFDAVVERYQRLGRVLVVLDLTHDLGIPVMAAVSWRMDGSAIMLGLAAHLDPHRAIVRAVSELNQALPALLAVQDRLWVRTEDRAIRDWLDSATTSDQSYVVPGAFPKVRAEQVRRSLHGNTRGPLATCLKLLRERELDMIALDMTRADTAFPTVRVVVPGLRHFWARLAPGRLYDVPLELGWVARRTEEADLNPIPFFL